MIRGILLRPFAWLNFVRNQPRVHGIPLSTSDEDRTYVTFRLNDAFSVLEQVQPGRAARVKANVYAFVASGMPKGKHMYMGNLRIMGIDTATMRTWSAMDLAAALVFVGTRAYLEVKHIGYLREKRQIAVADRAARQFRAIADRRQVWPVSVNPT